MSVLLRFTVSGCPFDVFKLFVVDKARVKLFPKIVLKLKTCLLKIQIHVLKNKGICILIEIMKKIFKQWCQQFNQYEINEQLPPASNHWTQKKKITTYVDGNAGHGLRRCNNVFWIDFLFEI